MLSVGSGDYHEAASHAAVLKSQRLKLFEVGGSNARIAALLNRVIQKLVPRGWARLSGSKSTNYRRRQAAHPAPQSSTRVSIGKDPGSGARHLQMSCFEFVWSDPSQTVAPR